MSLMTKSGSSLGSLVKHVTKIPKLDYQHSRYIWHMSTQSSDQNAIKLIQSSNICKFGSVKFQHTQAGKQCAKNMSDSVKPISSDFKSGDSEKTEKKRESWLDDYKLKTSFYKYGVRIDYKAPHSEGWMNIQLAVRTIDGKPTYEHGLPIHPATIEALNKKS